ncbi:MAG: hypothetical protein H6807_07925 [Planctomycetes bacterium]|nr:hypothetical protein [Planctomycetota bacterium]
MKSEATFVAETRQDEAPRRNPSDRSQDGFFSANIWLIVLLPLVAAFLLAWYNKKQKQTVREYGDADFDQDVLGNDDPVLVHFYREWSIGDQCMVQQVEKMASRRPPYRVGFVNVDRNEGLKERYGHIEPPALVLFLGGERVFQCRGVFDEADVHEEVLAVIARQRRGP